MAHRPFGVDHRHRMLGDSRRAFQNHVPKLQGWRADLPDHRTGSQDAAAGQAETQKWKAAIGADHHRSRKAGERRHRVRSLERAAEQASDKHAEITDLIAEAPTPGNDQPRSEACCLHAGARPYAGAGDCSCKLLLRAGLQADRHGPRRRLASVRRTHRAAALDSPRHTGRMNQSHFAKTFFMQQQLSFVLH